VAIIYLDSLLLLNPNIFSLVIINMGIMPHRNQAVPAEILPEFQEDRKMGKEGQTTHKIMIKYAKICIQHIVHKTVNLNQYIFLSID